MPIGFIWQTFLETPLVNLMVLLTVVCFGSYGLAILAFTVITRVVTFPLTIRTLHSTRAMQEIQPRLQELQKRYSDPKRRSEETMKLYRESGVNPLGCLGSQIVQFPIFIALYQVIRITLAGTPEGVLTLQSRLYNFDLLQRAIPLSTKFLFIDLGATGNIMLVVVVFCSMWLQTRISGSRNAAPAAGSQQQQMTQMMQWMMPAMFSYFVIVVPAGLGLYWAATTIIGIALQWKFVGPGDFTWGSLIPAAARARLRLVPARSAARTPTATSAADGGIVEARDNDGQSSGDQRRRRRAGNRAGARPARSQSRSGRRRRRS
ncbi:MAG: YidC/Oxa1 family membrane protein insertase [Dehalococcoidia bacterium]|nr:YidC/Oxa1 family membrane protein insertase [Dehalococcoidia bacterium]